MLPGSWPQLGWDIVAAEPHEWAGGIADRRLHTLAIHVRDGYTDTQLGHIIAHEFGHAWWDARLDTRQRAQWRHIRSLDDAPEYATGPHGNTAVTEDHAEAVKYTLTGRHDGHNPPTKSQIDQWVDAGLLPAPR